MPRGPKPAKSKEAKPRVARKSQRNERSKVRDLEKRLADAQQQLTATAEVLKLISRSIFELDPVLAALTEHATRLSGAQNGALARFDGERFTVAATYGPDREALEILRRSPIPLTRGTLVGRVGLERRTVHILDIRSDTAYEWHAWREKGEARTVLGVPMLRGGVLLGVLAFWRDRVKLFTDKQIALLETFADQAVIAIENVRLFNETKEALEQQTATGEILKVISSSPTDVQPVFEAVARSAARFCDAHDVVIVRLDGGMLHYVAGAGPFGSNRSTLEIPVTRESVVGRAVVDRATVHVRDLAAESEEEYAVGKALQRRLGQHTMLATPLLR